MLSRKSLIWKLWSISVAPRHKKWMLSKVNSWTAYFSLIKEKNYLSLLKVSTLATFIFQIETKGCIGGRVNCMAVYSGERSGHHRPSGPFASLREASRNLLVGREVGCSSAQHSPAASRVLPVRDRAGRSSTRRMRHKRTPYFTILSVDNFDCV